MNDMWRAYWAANKMIFKGAAKGGAAISQAVNDYASGRGVRRGILVPGDPPPRATAGASYYDYRGVLALRSVPQDLQAAEFPLGRYIHPGKGPRQPIGLPVAAVNRHVAVVGPTGAGKTTGVIVPWIIAGLRAGYSVVTIDVKGDLTDLVTTAVSGSGQPPPMRRRPDILDYTRPARSFGWNWLAEMDSDRAIDNAVQSIIGKQAPSGTDPFFFNLDAQILRGLLELVALSAARGSLTTSNLLRVLKDQDRLTKLIDRHPSSPAAARLRDLPYLDPDDYAKRITGVAVRLDALARPAVEAVTNRSDLRADDVLAGQRFVTVVAPLQDGQMASMLSSLFINQLLFRAYQRFAAPGGVPLLLVLDEAAQLADRVDYENVLSVARAAQVAVVVAVQDVAQFKDDNQRSVVFANCGTMICLAGVSGESAKLMAQRVGEHPVQVASVSTGPSPSGWGSSTSTSTSTQMVPVLGAREIMDPPFGGRSGVVHARDLASKPFLVDLTRQP